MKRGVPRWNVAYSDAATDIMMKRGTPFWFEPIQNKISRAYVRIVMIRDMS